MRERVGNGLTRMTSALSRVFFAQVYRLLPDNALRR
jgi:hypothetical protein